MQIIKTSVLKDLYYVSSHSICFLFRKTSSLYNPADCLSSLFDSKDMDAEKLADFGTNLPMVTLKQLHFFPMVCCHCITKISYNVSLFAMQVFFWNINEFLGKQDCII